MPNFSSSNWQCCFAGNSYSKMQDIRDVSRQPCPLWPHLSQVETWMHSTTDGCQSWVHSAVYFQKSGCQSRTQREGCIFLNPSSHSESLLHIFNVSFADGAYPPSTAGFQPLLSNSRCNFSAPFLNVLLPGFTRQCTEKPSQPVFRVRTQGESLR